VTLNVNDGNDDLTNPHFRIVTQFIFVNIRPKSSIIDHQEQWLHDDAG